MSTPSGTTRLRLLLRELPVVVTAMLLGSVLLGALGGVVGLVLGLRTYPPTAWFAVTEIGFPAAILGGCLGLPVGLIARWISRPPPDVATPVNGARR